MAPLHPPDSPSPPASPRPPKLISKLRKLFLNQLKFIGPGIVAAVAYCDPGNWATDLEAGSTYGYAHLFVILSASLMAIVLQILATRLGYITGKDLAQNCRIRFYDRPHHTKLWRWACLYPLYAICEAGIIFTDLAELLGSAIALTMLFPRLPLWVGVLLTAADVFIVLAFFNSYPDTSIRSRRSAHIFELTVSVLVLIVLVSFIILIVHVQPNWATTFKGFLPSRNMIAEGGLYVAVSIIGATVMPHSLFLGKLPFCHHHPESWVRCHQLPFDIAKEPLDLGMSTADTLSTSLAGSKVAISDRLKSLSSDGDKETHLDRSPSLPGTSDALSPSQQSSPPLPLQMARATRLHLRPISSVPTDYHTSVDHYKAHLSHASFDIAISLFTLALPINAAILIVAAAAFYYAGPNGPSQVADLASAYQLLTTQVGAGSAYVFAIALLIAGQAASITVTLAGQIVSEGFLEWHTSPVIRRLVTRLIGIVPSAIVSVSVGPKGVDQLLVGSQVALSLVLPFVVLPLIIFTSDPKTMSAPNYSLLPNGPSIDSPTSDNHHQIKVTDDDRLPRSSNESPTFENNLITKILLYAIFGVCCVANVYGIVQLAQGKA